MAFTRLAKSIPYYIADEICQAASHLIGEYDYIFYVSPKGVEIEDNGVRTTDAEYRNEIDKEIRQILNKFSQRNQRIVKLKGSTEERIQKIKQTLFS
jgi:nicotinamide riboside kinase